MVVKVTVYYNNKYIGIQTIVALAIAVLMHRLTQSTVIIRSIMLTPYLVSNVVAAIVFLWILIPVCIGNQFLDTGFVTSLLSGVIQHGYTRQLL